MSNTNHLISEINKNELAHQANELLATELGDHFDQHSLKINTENLSYSLTVEIGFVLSGIRYAEGDTATFDLYNNAL